MLRNFSKSALDNSETNCKLISRQLEHGSACLKIFIVLLLLMYILLWALGPITLLVQHTYTCTALYLYHTLMPPI